MSSEPRRLDRASRQQCWDARDALFHCLDAGSVEEEAARTGCAELRTLLGGSCPESWVGLVGACQTCDVQAQHFLQKHLNERQRAAEMKRLGAKDLRDAIASGDVAVRVEPV